MDVYETWIDNMRGPRPEGEVRGPKVMCCHCFVSWPSDVLWVDLSGQRWDVCQMCAGQEALSILQRLVAGTEEPISNGIFMGCIDMARSFLGLPSRTERLDEAAE